MRLIHFIASCLLCPLVAMADPQEDAAYISEQHFYVLNYDAELQRLYGEILPPVLAGFEKLGARITDPDRFRDAFVGTFFDDLRVDVQREFASRLTALLTAEDLATLAAYYASPLGQSCLEHARAGTDAPVVCADAYTRGPGVALVAQMPELLTEMDQIVRNHLARLSEIFALNRIADILDQPGMATFASDAHRKRLIAALRDAEN